MRDWSDDQLCVWLKVIDKMRNNFNQWISTLYEIIIDWNDELSNCAFNSNEVHISRTIRIWIWNPKVDNFVNNIHDTESSNTFSSCRCKLWIYRNNNRAFNDFGLSAQKKRPPGWSEYSRRQSQPLPDRLLIVGQTNALGSDRCFMDEAVRINISGNGHVLTHISKMQLDGKSRGNATSNGIGLNREHLPIISIYFPA
jgi:hypothetical protein